jgi:predicted lipoprotein with Yx(FWY)xxD motif
MRIRALLILVAAGTIGLAACGGDNSSSSSNTTAAAPAAAAATTAAPAAASAAATTATTDSDDSSYGASPATTAAASGAATAAATTVTLESTPLGMILADSKGMTLYIFTKDTPGASVCSAGCAKAWPPATVSGSPTAPSAVAAGALGTITRADGTTQLTINSQPLYTYAEDTAPGQTAGQNSGGTWFVVGPNGTAMKS